MAEGVSKSLRVTQIPRFQFVASDTNEAVFATSCLTQ